MNAPLRTPSSPSDSQPLAQVIAYGELRETGTVDSPAALSADSNPLHAVRATLQVCVGSVEMRIGDLMGAKEGQVLVLDSHVERPIELRIGNAIVARGQLVAVGEHFAVRITELPVPLRT